MVYFKGIDKENFYRFYDEDPLLIILLMIAIYTFNQLFSKYFSGPLTHFFNISDQIQRKKEFQHYFWRTSYYFIVAWIEFLILFEKDYFWDTKIAIRGAPCTEEE